MSHVFREYDIRGVAERDLTPDFVRDLGKSLATFYQKRNVNTISVGYDCRLSSVPFKTILIESLLQSGMTVYDIGLSPTPLVYFSLFSLPVGGGVMITGSHNPPNENGFKICLGKTTIFGEEIQELRRIMEARDYRTGQGTLIEKPIIAEYLADLKGRIHPGAKPLKVVLDAGNGTGNLLAVPLYRSLGWEVIELFSEPDGNFPNHHPDPTIPENLADLKAEVLANRADLGISFDGDADRIGVIDAQGRVLWGDQLMIIYAGDIVKTKPGAKIIGEVKCSQTMFDRIREMQGDPIMWKVGHSLIKAKMKEEGALLAGEMSGHLFFADRYYGYDDAIYSGARLLEILSHASASLSEMVDGLPKTYSTPEIRVDCPENKKFNVVRELARRFQAKYQVIDIDGARIIFPNGWGLVRASNTQPVLVTRFEANSNEALQAIREEVQAALQKLLA
jgi:phosphomannomutase/phosphoglucomutase